MVVSRRCRRPQNRGRIREEGLKSRDNRPHFGACRGLEAIVFDKDLAQVLERLRELIRCCLLKLLHGSAGADVCSTDKTPSILDQLCDPLTAMSQGVRTPAGAQ